MSETLFHNKKKNLFVGVMAAAYPLITLLSGNFMLHVMTSEVSWRYNLNTLFIWLFSHATTISFLIYLLIKKKEFLFKKWIIPLGFGLSCLRSLLNFPYAVMFVSEYATVYTVTVFVFTCLSALALVLCFVGALFDFEFIKLFRVGIMLQVFVPIALLVTETVYYVINGYYATYGLAGLSIISLAELLISILFNVSIFLLTVNKEENQG